MQDKSAIIKRTIYSLISLFILYIIFYFWLDIPIDSWAQQTFAGTWLFTLSKSVNKIFMPEMWLIAGIVVGAIGFFIKANKPQQARSCFLFSLSIILAYIVCAILKFVLARYRPVEFFTNHLYGFHFFAFGHDITSTPSGVATMAFAGFYALAVIIGKRWLTALFMLLAILISLSRIVLLDHYPSDIIFGIYLGILSVYWCCYLLSYKSYKPHK